MNDKLRSFRLYKRLIMNKISLTKHSIEEYIKDNPKIKNPEENLMNLVISILWKLKDKKCKFVISYNWNHQRFCYNDEVIILENYYVITYFRKYNKKITLHKIKVKEKIKNIFNWNLEKVIEKQIELHNKRKLKRIRKINTKNNIKIAKRYYMIWKCF